MKESISIQPEVNVKSLCDDTKISLIKDVDIDLIKKHIDELNAIAVVMDMEHHPSPIVVVDNETLSGNTLVSLTGFLDDIFPIRDVFASLDDICSFDIYDGLHQEPFAGKKEEFGEFSIKHNRKNLQKDNRYINKKNRSRRFSKKG